MGLKYTEGTASKQDIYSHLMTCDENFISRLKEKVNIQDYSGKISEKAVTFEAWGGDALAGLVAAYLNDPNTQTGYITSVSTIKTYAGRGIASVLINNCVTYARQHGFKSIFLEVEKANDHAVSLYKTYRFQEFEDNNASMLMKLAV
ncbi:MAG: GNAT family N-acetyltransferase [Candidatus Omnitrophota bacterium]|nr:GNAT family N-acetyltransferase [Candidatus Omnitrophota bacterium]